MFEIEGKKRKKFVKFSNDNLAWGITALVVICAAIMFYLILTMMSSVSAVLRTLGKVLMPVIMGCAMAYILIPVYNCLRRFFDSYLPGEPGNGSRLAVNKALSNVLTHVLLIVVVVGLISLAGPQVIESIVHIFESLPSTIDFLIEIVEDLFKDYPTAAGSIINLLGDFEAKTMNLFTKYVVPYLSQIIGGITTGVINAVGIIFDVIVGFIVSVYLLNGKDVFSGQAKKITYSILKVEDANRLISSVRDIHRIFSGFISGKIIDSLIIGSITFCCLSIMKMPYTVIVSVVVGLTNIIPFFGPFIGAIPSALIILTADPVKSLYFLIYIIIIQQIDGNIIGPKILGNSTGLPSILVLFSILTCGGLFGFPGMILGVPVFATVYLFAGRAVENSLRRKALDTESDAYINLDHIDPETGEMVESSDLKASETGKVKASEDKTEVSKDVEADE